MNESLGLILEASKTFENDMYFNTQANIIINDVWIEDLVLLVDFERRLLAYVDFLFVTILLEVGIQVLLSGSWCFEELFAFGACFCYGYYGFWCGYY